MRCRRLMDINLDINLASPSLLAAEAPPRRGTASRRACPIQVSAGCRVFKSVLMSGLFWDFSRGREGCPRKSFNAFQ